MCFHFSFLLLLCQQISREIKFIFLIFLFFLYRRYFTVLQNVVFSVQIELCFNKNSREKFSSALILIRRNIEMFSSHLVFTLFYTRFTSFSLFIYSTTENEYYLKQQIVILNRFRNWKSSNKISCNHFLAKSKLWKKDKSGRWKK